MLCLCEAVLSCNFPHVKKCLRTFSDIDNSQCMQIYTSLGLLYLRLMFIPPKESKARILFLEKICTVI